MEKERTKKDSHCASEKYAKIMTSVQNKIAFILGDPVGSSKEMDKINLVDWVHEEKKTTTNFVSHSVRFSVCVMDFLLKIVNSVFFD